MASERVKYPVYACKRCRQPTISGMGTDGLCRLCVEKNTKAKRIKLERRMLEFLRTRKDRIDWTGFEDVRAAVYDEPEKTT